MVLRLPLPRNCCRAISFAFCVTLPTPCLKKSFNTDCLVSHVSCSFFFDPDFFSGVRNTWMTISISFSSSFSSPLFEYSEHFFLSGDPNDTREHFPEEESLILFKASRKDLVALSYLFGSSFNDELVLASSLMTCIIREFNFVFSGIRWVISSFWLISAERSVLFFWISVNSIVFNGISSFMFLTLRVSFFILFSWFASTCCGILNLANSSFCLFNSSFLSCIYLFNIGNICS